MWTILLKGLKSWKLVLSGVGVLCIVLFGFHYLNLKNTNENLGVLVQQQKRELQNLEQQNSQQLKEFNLLEDSLAQYQEALGAQDKRNKELIVQLGGAGDNDDKLKECLGTPLSDALINRLRE